MTTVPLDSKRDEFKRYLERSGVMNALTNALVLLYEEEEKPEDAIGFLLMKLMVGRPELEELNSLREEVARLRLDVSQLQNRNSVLEGTATEEIKNDEIITEENQGESQNEEDQDEKVTEMLENLPVVDEPVEELVEQPVASTPDLPKVEKSAPVVGEAAPLDEEAPPSVEETLLPQKASDEKSAVKSLDNAEMEAVVAE